MQKRRGSPQFETYANLFDLIKVYCAGWLHQPGLAFSGGTHIFSPGGPIFKEVSEGPKAITAVDLMAAFLLQKAAAKIKFGREAEKDKKDSRRQTRFLFYSITIRMVRDMLEFKNKPMTPVHISKALKKILESDDQSAQQALLQNAVLLIDDYMKSSEEEIDHTVYKEKFFREFCGRDLNQFFKHIGKTNAETPELAELQKFYKICMKRSMPDTACDFSKMATACGF
jgi:hypothetical protein